MAIVHVRSFVRRAFKCTNDALCGYGDTGVLLRSYVNLAFNLIPNRLKVHIGKVSVYTIVKKDLEQYVSKIKKRRNPTL